MLDSRTIDLFKVIVLDSDQAITKPQLGEIERGYITNFIPNPKQKAALDATFRPLPITTLFSVEERHTADPRSLIMKQILHYIEVYGLDTPGLFNLEVTNGKVVVVGNVRGVTVAELGDLVRTLIYANAPIKNLDDVINLIRLYEIPYNLNLVKNNEARIRLYREGDRFNTGDDAVRWIVYKTTNDTLLIKSKEVVEAVRTGESAVPLSFLLTHEIPLSQVFNRHKRIIMALKNRRTNTSINRISHLSKATHVPIIPAINKTFIAKALSGEIKDTKKALKAVTLRDKFKYLNLLEWRRLQKSEDVFIIRNGRSHIENDRKVYEVEKIDALIKNVLASVRDDLKHLKTSTILLDPNVDYGLPSSQKQMIGNLPFGTTVSVGANVISSGVYWEDAWGARDLDLSTIDEIGQRTGWGMFSGYDRDNSITFSGDITSAPNGAMEFMTSKTNRDDLTYGLFVNIYSGEVGCGCELVIGSQTEKAAAPDETWIKDPVIREKLTLHSRGTILGFIRNGRFVVYAPRVSNSRVSGRKTTQRLVAKALAPAWTVRRLLDAVGIEYSTVPSGPYEHDLSYASFSIDKLEKMLFNSNQHELVAKGVP